MAEEIEVVAYKRRPGVVTFIGVVMYIQAAIAAVAAIVVFLERNNQSFQQLVGRTANELLGTAIGEAIIAVLLAVVAGALLSGAKWARFAVALVEGLRLVFSIWAVYAHIGGGFQWNALITAAIALFVLWALYGNKESDEYFSNL